MGTRHLICVSHNDQCKVAQYGQWDGYPAGQGVNILAFLREMTAINLVLFGNRVDATVYTVCCKKLKLISCIKKGGCST